MFRKLELPVKIDIISGTKRSSDSLSRSGMVWSEHSLGTLIEYVEKYKCLYDNSELHFYNDANVSAIWRKIGLKLGKTASQARDTWRQLYKTYQWLTKSEEGKANEECTWPYLERMTFLKPHLIDTACTADDTMGEQLIDFEATMEAGIPVPAFIGYVRPENESSEQDNVESSSQVEESEYSPSHVQQQHHPPFHPPLNGIALQKTLEIEEALCQYLKKKVNKEKDPNELFLTSVAHDMKMLPIKEQAVFKMKVQQLLVEMISKSSDQVLRESAAE